MPPQAVSVLRTPAVKIKKTIHQGAQDETRSNATPRPQGVAPVISLRMVRAGINPTASRTARRTVRLAATRYLLRLRLRADPMIHSVCAR